MKPDDLGTLFDDLLARGVTTVVELDRPLDIAPADGTTYTIPGLTALVRGAAGWLHAMGVEPGDRVAVIKANHWDYVLLACAAARLGAIPALISDHLAPAAQQVLLKRLDAAVLVTTRAVLDRARTAETDLIGHARRVLCLDSTYPDAVHVENVRGTEPPPPVRRAPDDTLIVLHTAGTTGTPKLVVHTTRTLVHGIANGEAKRVPVVTAKKTDIVCSAIAYAHGRSVPWTASVLWLDPAKILIISDSEPRAAERVLRAHPPTVLEALPATYVRWRHMTSAVDNPFSIVRLYISTLDAVHPPTLRAYLHAPRRRPVWLQVWDQTETGPLTFRLLTRRSVRRVAERHPATRDLGRPIPGRTRVRVVNPTTLEKAPTGTPGLLLVRTPTRARGYVGEESRYTDKTHGRWWNTGDMGLRTRTGSYLLLDREVDTIPGHSCVELEDVLEDRLPDALECVVLGTPGRLPIPVVVTPTGHIDPSAWAWAVRDLPALADPVTLTWEQVPRTGTGQVRRMALRTLVRRGQDTFGTGRWT